MGVSAGRSCQTSGRCDGRSGRAPFVPMVEALDLGDRHDVAITGRRDRARNRRVLVERQVRSGSFVVRTIAKHQLPQTRFVEHDHVIETLATSGSNKSLDECILPRRVRGREYLINPHRPEAVERAIAIVVRYRGASAHGNASRSC